MGCCQPESPAVRLGASSLLFVIYWCKATEPPKFTHFELQGLTTAFGPKRPFGAFISKVGSPPFSTKA